MVEVRKADSAAQFYFCKVVCIYVNVCTVKEGRLVGCVLDCVSAFLFLSVFFFIGFIIKACFHLLLIYLKKIC